MATVVRNRIIRPECLTLKGKLLQQINRSTSNHLLSKMMSIKFKSFIDLVNRKIAIIKIQTFISQGFYKSIQ